jgi:hypothetical protein
VGSSCLEKKIINLKKLKWKFYFYRKNKLCKPINIFSVHLAITV